MQKGETQMRKNAVTPIDFTVTAFRSLVVEHISINMKSSKQFGHFPLGINFLWLQSAVYEKKLP